MAHCPYEKLKDLESVLDKIRKWDGIREPKNGIFYFKSVPFLHFHIKDGKRWADAKLGKEWGPPMDILFEATAKQKAAFLKEAEHRYQSMLKTK